MDGSECKSREGSHNKLTKSKTSANNPFKTS